MECIGIINPSYQSELQNSQANNSEIMYYLKVRLCKQTKLYQWETSLNLLAFITRQNSYEYSRGWREPGNKTLQKSKIFGMVLFMRGVTDHEGRPAWQRQSGAGAGRDSWSCSELGIPCQRSEKKANVKKWIFFLMRCEK